MGERLARRYRVYGRVQGVGFRDFAARAARRAGVTGWVRNQADGTVDALAVGTDDQLGRWRRDLETGPPRARVERVEEEDVAAQPGLDSFEIRG